MFYNANFAMDHLKRLLFLPTRWELRYCITRLGQITLGAAVVQFLSSFEGEESLPVTIRLVDVHQTVLGLEGHLSPADVSAVNIF